MSVQLASIAIEAAKQAGELLVSGFGTHFQVESKAGVQDLVTTYDRLSQKLIIDLIKKKFPRHHFLAEEDNVAESPSDEVLWIIDPLDGTINFAHAIPFFAISIAAAIGKEIVCGVVYHPMQKELFVVEKGGGAYLNGKKILVTGQSHFERALLATGFPYNVQENPLQCVDRFASIAKTGVPIRRLGVASLDLAYVAAGRFDAFWEVGLHPWDMAAGKLLVEEAGGKVTHYDGKKHQIFGYLSMLATNGHLHDKMVNILKKDLA